MRRVIEERKVLAEFLEMSHDTDFMHIRLPHFSDRVVFLRRFSRGRIRRPHHLDLARSRPLGRIQSHQRPDRAPLQIRQITVKIRRSLKFKLRMIPVSINVNDIVFSLNLRLDLYIRLRKGLRNPFVIYEFR